MTATLALWIACIGLAAAAGLFLHVRRWPVETGLAAARADEIRLGARTFLVQEYGRMAMVGVIVAGVLGATLGPPAVVAFAAGAAASGLAGVIGMATATRANLRTAVAAHGAGRGPALTVAFLGGAVMGLSVASLGLLGLGGLFLLAEPGGTEYTAFGLGASLVALFARVGGGIFTKSADIGADLVGKVEAGIAEDDARNPGVIADNVGDNVGDVAGMGADIFESYCAALIATIALAATMPAEQANALGGRDVVLALPIALAGIGLVASLVALGVVRAASNRKPEQALGLGVVAATVLFLLASGLGMVIQGIPPAAWVAVLAGTLAGVSIGAVTEFYTNGPPVRRLARAAHTGAAPVVIRGLALGMESAAVPVLVIGLAMYVATETIGLYGVGLAATGMLATTGMVMAVDAYGPIADNAGGLAEMSGMGDETRAITDDLDAVGNTTAAIGKGYAIGAAALAALGLMSAYVETVRAALPGFSLHLADPQVLFGGFVGALLPFLFTALTLTAVGRTAEEIILEIRRQFRDIPGLVEGRVRPDSERCTAIASRSALRRMLLPGSMALLAPVVVGVVGGPGALGGMLGVALPTGVVLALVLANAGGAWDNAKKYIEKGHHGGKGSEAHAAAVVGDTVGDPCKDTAGPSMNILIKLLAIVSLALVPMIA
ncbi:MAG: sodium-translocating pyrophosphatase [Halofilum sp. (in: g-proteobacteria)]|nr:sodium-translocating pyrophosphatase [Halofilum sp. (in: g-proteobacteria)]